jgi:hypothetical protein
MINSTKDWIYDLYIKETINRKIKPIPKEQHLNRGSCCGNGCLHCPYIPKYEKGATDTK